MSTRRPRRAPEPIDVTPFREHIAEALAAFATDVSYAVAMARAAVIIVKKRQVWQARKELRAAEAQAHAECRQATFDCHAVSPCGAGDCKFAQGEYAALDVAAPGTAVRPQQRSIGGYSLEPAVAALVARRSTA